MAEWLRWQCFRDMKYIVHDLEVVGLNPSQVELGMHCILSISHLNQNYLSVTELSQHCHSIDVVHINHGIVGLVVTKLHACYLLGGTD